MGDATPCSPSVCGVLFARCGKYTTYTNHKCRCSACKEASKRYQREYRARNSIAKKDYDKWYYESNKAEVLRKQGEYHRRHRERILEAKRKYAAARRDEISRKAREYYAANKERVSKSARNRYFSNREREIARAKQWADGNADKAREAGRRRRARKRQAAVIPFTSDQLVERMSYYGYRCYLKLPGVCTGGFEHVEHVKPLAKGGAHVLANLRPACRPCNAYKSDKWPFRGI
jgi:5-methylcytosine-specific restriction endonuclease McrA